MNFSKILSIVILVVLAANARPTFAAEKLAGSSATFISYFREPLADRRVDVLKAYLQQYDSPLADYAKVFVDNADKYNLDWRLVAAISGLESTFGHAIPINSYNGWGWGIYGDNVLRFNSWPEAIETISKGLRENYLKDKVESDPYFIGPTYAASPTWAVRVQYFMDSIEAFKLNQPKSSLSLSI